MTVHHLFFEEDVKEMCPYCGDDLKDKKWKTELHSELHYKNTKCNCGREIHLRVKDFMGSGHDGWNEKEKPEKEITIEHKVEKEHKKVKKHKKQNAKNK